MTVDNISASCRRLVSVPLATLKTSSVPSFEPAWLQLETNATWPPAAARSGLRLEQPVVSPGQRRM